MEINNQGRSSQAVEQEINKAVQLFYEGRYTEADEICQSILGMIPDLARLLSLRGTIAIQSGNPETAVKCFEEALEIEPGNPDLHHDYGKVLYMTGRFDGSLKSYRKSLELGPDNAMTWLDMGNVLYSMNNIDEAIDAFNKSATIDPGSAQPYFNLGVSLEEKRKYNEAIINYRRALDLQPSHSGAWNNLGGLLRFQGEYNEAISCFENALKFSPQFENAIANIAHTLQDAGNFDKALQYYQRALDLAPDYAGAHFNRSICHLLMGDLTRGWEEFGWRWKMEDLKSRKRDFTEPEWDGSSSEGRTILVYMEQGFGDAFQFIRYVPLLIQQGFEVIVQCDERIRKVLGTISDVITIPGPDDLLPEFHVQVPAMNLPALFHTEIDSIPCHIPYLNAEAELENKWRIRLQKYAGLKVGICWRGYPEHRNDINRSFVVEECFKIACIPGICLFSLQKPLSIEDSMKLQESPDIVELGSVLDQGKEQFLDTAAIIENLDLVITADTAVAHLAGALGRPVWILLPFVPDWRWMYGRSDSPWYPTMRLFRQPEFGDWESVFREVGKALVEWLEK